MAILWRAAGKGRLTISPVMNATDSNTSSLTALGIAVLFGLFLVLTSSLQLFPGIWQYDSKRLLQFGLLATLFAVAIVNPGIRQSLSERLAATPPWARICLWLFLLLGLLSMGVNALSWSHGLSSVTDVALTASLILGIFCVAACRDRGREAFDRTVMGAILLTGLVVGAQELLAVVALQLNGFQHSYEMSLGTFAWPRFYNQLQSWMIPLVAAVPLVFKGSRLAAILTGLVLCLHWYLVLFTAARGTFLGVMAASGFAALFLPAIRWRYLSWQAGGFLLGAMLYFLGVWFSTQSMNQSETMPANPDPEIAQSATTATGTASPPSSGTEPRPEGDSESSNYYRQSLGRDMLNSSGRFSYIWPGALDLALDHPLLGIGPGNFACIDEPRVAHPHNLPLQLASEWGWPATLLAAVLYLWALMRAVISCRRSQCQGLAPYLLCGLLAASVHALFSGIWVMPASQVIGILVCGMLLSSMSGLSDSARSQLPVPVLGFLLVLFMVFVASQQMPTVEQTRTYHGMQQFLTPRIWQDAGQCKKYLDTKRVTQ